MNLEDIAKLAGVSKSAVSLALNGKPGVSENTRRRILKIAEEHGYRPKARTDAQNGDVLTFLACVNTGLVQQQYYEQPFFRELIQHIEERCSMHGYSLQYSTVSVDDVERSPRAAVEKVRGRGCILLGTNLDAGQLAALHQALGPHTVVLDTMCETLPVHVVAINNLMGGYQAGKHLCELGHRRFGYLASAERIRNFEERRRGFMAALAECGVTVADEAVFSASPSMLHAQAELRERFANHLAAGRDLPTAVFCECDYIAIGAIKAMQSLGIRVPEDVSVVGFDNISEASIITPEMTTVHVEKKRLAYLAVDLLVDSFEREDGVKQKIAVDTRLVIRNTTIRAAAADSPSRP